MKDSIMKFQKFVLINLCISLGLISFISVNNAQSTGELQRALHIIDMGEEDELPVIDCSSPGTTCTVRIPQ